MAQTMQIISVRRKSVPLKQSRYDAPAVICKRHTLVVNLTVHSASLSLLEKKKTHMLFQGRGMDHHGDGLVRIKASLAIFTGQSQ
jgi:hypothetical protein